MSREEFARIHAEFGAEIAGQVMCDGGDYAAAQALHVAAVKEENAQLKAKLAEGNTAGTAAAVAAAAGKSKKLFNTGK